MAANDLPIYLVSLGNGEFGLEVGPDLIAALAFGGRECAQRYIDHWSGVKGIPKSLYRIVEYRPTGEVFEG